MLEKIESTQTHAEVYLYETWGSPFSSAEDGTTIAEMESKLRSAYTAAGGQFGLHVTYVGAAFTDAYYNGGIYLWDTDNRHQGFAGGVSERGDAMWAACSAPTCARPPSRARGFTTRPRSAKRR